MGIGVKYAGFTGWAILIFGKGDWVIDMASLRGSNTYLAFTPGSRLGLLMCRPAGAFFCGFASGFTGWAGLSGLILIFGAVMGFGCLVWLIG